MKRTPVAVTNNTSFQNYPHLKDHMIRNTDTPGLKAFTINTCSYFERVFCSLTKHVKIND